MVPTYYSRKIYFCEAKGLNTFINLLRKNIFSVPPSTASTTWHRRREVIYGHFIYDYPYIFIFGIGDPPNLVLPSFWGQDVTYYSNPRISYFIHWPSVLLVVLLLWNKSAGKEFSNKVPLSVADDAIYYGKVLWKLNASTVVSSLHRQR